MAITPEGLAQLFQRLPEPKPIFHRLYYNDDGTPICYSMEDLPGKYIEIDQATYAKGLYNVRVIDGRIVEIVPKVTIKKLKPSEHGTCCDPQDICVIVDPAKPHTKWSVTTNEID